MTAIISLTTDFGLSDPYVAAMKGVILSRNPDAVIVDISHDIRPQRIEQGAFVLAAAWPYFPAGSIHIAVVDPGVGTSRAAIVLSTPKGTFVGPDNGILSAALPDEERPACTEGPRRVSLPAGHSARCLSDDRFHRRPVSETFHGRDIFAPVAAHLSLGVPPEELGPRLSEVVALPAFRAVPLADGALAGRIVHVDRFGNLVSDVHADQLLSNRITAEIGGRRIAGLGRTYAESEGLVALIGSSGFLEVALREGSAAREIGADVGDTLVVRSAL